MDKISLYKEKTTLLNKYCILKERFHYNIEYCLPISPILNKTVINS